MEIKDILNELSEIGYYIGSDFEDLLEKYKKSKKEKNDILLALLTNYIKISFDYYQVSVNVTEPQNMLIIKDAKKAKAFKKLMSLLKELKQKIFIKLADLIEKSKKDKDIPITLKVAKIYNLNFSDLVCLIYILLCYSHHELKYTLNYFFYAYRSSVIDLGKIGLNVQEVKWFIDKRRRHIKDGIILLDL